MPFLYNPAAEIVRRQIHNFPYLLLSSLKNIHSIRRRNQVLNTQLYDVHPSLIEASISTPSLHPFDHQGHVTHSSRITNIICSNRISSNHFKRRLFIKSVSPYVVLMECVVDHSATLPQRMINKRITQSKFMKQSLVHFDTIRTNFLLIYFVIYLAYRLKSSKVQAINQKMSVSRQKIKFL